MLAGVVPGESLARTLRLIGATQHHMIPDDLPADERDDMAVFLDMDLSILGAAPQTFDAYEAGVRHEYREVPEPLFPPGPRGNPGALPRSRGAVFQRLGTRAIRRRGA